MHQRQGERALVVQAAAYFHRQAVPKVVNIGHGLQQVNIGLLAQLEVALDFEKDLLLELAHGALAVQQIQKDTWSKRGLQGPDNLEG